MRVNVRRHIQSQLGQSIFRFFAALIGIFLIVGQTVQSKEVRTMPPDVTVIHDIQYSEVSDACRLDLAMPKARGDNPRPGLVIIHGGGWLEGDKSSFVSLEHWMPGNIIDFAQLGFVAASINYRLSGEAPFPAGVEDCKAAVRWLRAHADQYNLDVDYIGAYGNSAGGHLALMLGMAGEEAGLEGDGPHQEQSSMVQAVVSDSGHTDLLYQHRHDQLRQAIQLFLGGPPEGERIWLYKQASPSTYVNEENPPLLLLYGTADTQIGIEASDQLVVALDRGGAKDVSYFRLAYVDHCPHSLIRIPYLQTVVNDFFIRTLMHPETATQIQQIPDE